MSICFSFCDCRKKSFLFAALYAAFILGGRHVMKQREKFELRKPLVLWSLTLAVFRWETAYTQMGSNIHSQYLMTYTHTFFKCSKLICHSQYCLCSCSIFGAVRTGSYMMYILMTKGLQQSVCDQSFYNGPVSKFWAYAFVLSKAPELGKSRPLFTAYSSMYLISFCTLDKPHYFP